MDRPIKSGEDVIFKFDLPRLDRGIHFANSVWSESLTLRA